MVASEIAVVEISDDRFIVGNITGMHRRPEAVGKLPAPATVAPAASVPAAWVDGASLFQPGQ